MMDSTIRNPKCGVNRASSITKAISARTSPISKASNYGEQASKYLHDARKLLDEEDYLQASEKLWGASASFVKAVAERKRLSHDGHARLFRVVSDLAKKTGDEEINTLFHVANSLHINFYESWLTPEQVKNGKKSVERLIQKLKKILDDKK